MAVDRLLAILTTLMGRGETTAGQLAQRFEVSVKTIYRDIQKLCLAGAPIVTQRGSGGGIKLMEGYALDKSLFTPRERQDLLSALQALAASGQPGAENLLCKISALFQPGERAEWLRIDLSPWGSGLGTENLFNRLRDAILEHRKVAFDYIGSTGARSGRVVEPYQLIYKGGGWYLSAYDPLRSAQRLFKLSRMRGIRPGPECFEPRPFEDIPADNPYQGPDSVRLLLRFERRAEFRLPDEFPDEMLARLADGRFLAWPSWRIDDWVYGYLMSYGDMVTVLSPGYVREELIRRTRAALNRQEKSEIF